MFSWWSKHTLFHFWKMFPFDMLNGVFLELADLTTNVALGVLIILDGVRRIFGNFNRSAFDFWFEFDGAFMVHSLQEIHSLKSQIETGHLDQ